MIKRLLETRILESLDQFPAVSLVGPRQVGKTTLALSIAGSRRSHFFDLENPRHRLLLQDPLGALSSLKDKLVIIDEAQMVTELFPVLRVLIDERRSNGRFLLLGSASPNLRRQSAESLAGRLQTLQLHPFSLLEIADTEGLWIWGGFPPAYLAANGKSSITWRRAYIRDLVERDLHLLGFDLPPERMHRFLLMLAHLHGQLWNGSQLGRSLGVSPATANRYLDVVLQTMLVKRLSPYFTNLGKRLVKAPKVYLADSGLFHALLDITDKPALLAHPAAGPSWEGFVLQQLETVLVPPWELSFWRTAAGAEIDLLVLKNGRPEIAVECKVNITHPKPRRGFHQGCADLQIKNRWVVYPGTEQLPLSGDIDLLPLSTAMKRLRDLVHD